MQVSHSQPIEGTPVEVPVPRNVSFINFFFVPGAVYFDFETKH